MLFVVRFYIVLVVFKVCLFVMCGSVALHLFFVFAFAFACDFVLAFASCIVLFRVALLFVLFWFVWCDVMCCDVVLVYV